MGTEGDEEQTCVLVPIGATEDGTRELLAAPTRKEALAAYEGVHLQLPNQIPRRPANYYNRFLAEREEILRHKWIESEKAGYDIGFDGSSVLIIGSGAGGGTLGNELAQKGIRKPIISLNKLQYKKSSRTQLC
jgi:hypothetical protein